VFVLPDPENSKRIWGFYTLSAASLSIDGFTKSDRGRAINHVPAPMIMIGFMGMCDRAPRKLGPALITDAARRTMLMDDIAVWGITLESENGPRRPKLWQWYQKQNFKILHDPSRDNALYAPLRALIPKQADAP
jgi:hypothetical protein